MLAGCFWCVSGCDSWSLTDVAGLLLAGLQLCWWWCAWFFRFVSFAVTGYCVWLIWRVGALWSGWHCLVVCLAGLLAVRVVLYTFGFGVSGFGLFGVLEFSWWVVFTSVVCGCFAERVIDL